MSMPRFRMFAIYERTEDRPDAYVIREWIMIEGAFQPGDASSFATLDGARAALPPGATKAEWPDPDPTIIEVWLAPAAQ